MKKVESIVKLKSLGLPTPPTIIIKNFEEQLNEINNFLSTRTYVMIRSDKDDGMNCPRILKCPSYNAKEHIRRLNENGYVVILQDYVPLNNRYSGNALVLENLVVIEAIEGGPVSKISREGIIHQHVQLSKSGELINFHGREVIPKDELIKIFSIVRNLPKYHIYEFSSGPNWFYFWQAREDKTSRVLD